MIIHGRKFLLQEQGGDTFAASNSCSLSLECDTLEVASTTGTFREYVAGMQSWKASTNVLVTNVAGTFAAVGQTYTLVIGDEENSDELTGDAICTSFKVSAQVGNLVSGTFEFQGTGALSQPVTENNT